MSSPMPDLFDSLLLDEYELLWSRLERTRVWLPGSVSHTENETRLAGRRVRIKLCGCYVVIVLLAARQMPRNAHATHWHF